MNNILLLGSQSESRRRLLADISVPFVQIDQSADEAQCDWNLPLQQLVESIAKHKMQHVIMPHLEDGQEAFVLTADTLTFDKKGTPLGKPLSRERAKEMLRAIREGALVGSAFCLDKKRYEYDTWQIKERMLGYVEAELIFDVPDEAIETYLDNTIALKASGAITVEGYGAQFFKYLNGSFTTVQGLPLFELRQALEHMDFF